MKRILGIDLARFIALSGMILVNFNLVMGAPSAQSPIWMSVFEGKAAATFVVLAGLGVGLSAKKGWTSQNTRQMLIRAAILLAFGTLNMMIFPADILHFYAFYFALGILVVPMDMKAQIAVTLLVTLAFPIAYFVFDYGQFWNFATLEYENIFTPQNYVTNLIFNGWHPILPWFGFFCFGLILSKLDLTSQRTATILAACGAAGLIITPLLSDWVYQLIFQSFGVDFADLFTTSPVPPGPLYVATGVSAALATIGLCLLLPEHVLENRVFKALRTTGQQTFTHYVAHIIIGMGIIEATGLLGTSAPSTIVIVSSTYLVAAIAFSAIWSKRFKLGPLETMMRKVSG